MPTFHDSLQDADWNPSNIDKVCTGKSIVWSIWFHSLTCVAIVCRAADRGRVGAVWCRHVRKQTICVWRSAKRPSNFHKRHETAGELTENRHKRDLVTHDAYFGHELCNCVSYGWQDVKFRLRLDRLWNYDGSVSWYRSLHFVETCSNAIKCGPTFETMRLRLNRLMYQVSCNGVQAVSIETRLMSVWSVVFIYGFIHTILIWTFPRDTSINNDR